jgi:hypothetical protein
MKKVLAVAFVVAGIASFGVAEENIDLNSPHVMHAKDFAKPGGGGSSNLSYHNGPVIHTAKVVFIFWNGTNGDGFSTFSGYASTLASFRNQFGMTSHYGIIGQYYDTTGNINGSPNLAAGTADWLDNTNNLPSDGNVTDALVQAEVSRYLAFNTFDNSTAYEVVLPATLQGGAPVYSSSGTSDSCGGPHLVYCAYHSHYTSGSNTVKYSIEPYPSCSGCQATGFNDVQNQEHFVTHETRETVTDELGSAWFDRRGNEADDKCAWSPAPFLDGTYGYQDEWSNAASGCVP